MLEDSAKSPAQEETEIKDNLDCGELEMNEDRNVTESEERDETTDVKHRKSSSSINYLGPAAKIS